MLIKSPADRRFFRMTDLDARRSESATSSLQDTVRKRWQQQQVHFLTIRTVLEAANCGIKAPPLITTTVLLLTDIRDVHIL